MSTLVEKCRDMAAQAGHYGAWSGGVLLEQAADEVEALRAALLRIVELDPGEDSDEGHNEWGEADCFNQAQEIARKALAPPALTSPVPLSAAEGAA